MKECPKCGGQELTKGVQYGHGNIFPESMSMFKSGSEIVHTFCVNCGLIVESYVKRPEKFKRKSGEQ